MRIAQVAPLFESVPPQLYGGTERVVHNLEGALVELGHEVHVFASGDSQTRGVLHPACPRALRLDQDRRDFLSPQILQLEQLMRLEAEFDLVHFHVDSINFPLARRMKAPTLTTLHGRLDLPDIHDLFREFRELPFSSISDDQRRPMPFLNWQGTVLHGLPLDSLRFQPEPEGHLAFLGRISPEKRPDRAIEIARLAGRRIKIAAKVDRADRDYFESIRPLLAQPHVDFIGEIGESEKSEFLGRASALLFPIDWPEPFGLVMVEAMATGTPVIAFPQGSVPEVIRPGVSGFIVNSVTEAAHAVVAAERLSRFAVRREFEQRFGARRMAEDYVRLYERLVRQEEPSFFPRWEPAEVV